jgi:EAL domain-containing protein (putative c-di-GMP-specific phosphodiesterase class I)
VALHTLRRLKALGVSIAMDDFGTGYSSLSTLQSFPFDKIKIDRSFINILGKHRKSASIIRAILALGHSLEIPVLAEGIETKEHLDFMREEGCDEGQGYFLGRPLPADLIFPRTATDNHLPLEAPRWESDGLTWAAAAPAAAATS